MIHRTQGNTYIYGFILKDLIKDTEEQPDAKVQRVTLCVLALSLCRILIGPDGSTIILGEE